MKFSAAVVLSLAAGCSSFTSPRPLKVWGTKLKSTAVVEESSEQKTAKLLAKADALLAGAPSPEKRKELESAMGLFDEAFCSPDELETGDKTVQLLAKADALLASVEGRKKIELTFAAPVAADSVTTTGAADIAEGDRTAKLLAKADALLASVEGRKKIESTFAADPVAAVVTTTDAAVDSEETGDKAAKLLAKANMLLASAPSAEERKRVDEALAAAAEAKAIADAKAANQKAFEANLA